MSQISTIYDALVTRMTALYPSHKRLTNPYKPDENVERTIELGWGLAVGPAVNTDRQLSCQLSLRRSFVFVLTRKAYALEDAITRKDTAIKNILEDELLIIKDFEKDSTLNNTISMAHYISDNGVEFVHNQKDNFLMIRASIDIEYFENLLP